MTTNTGPGPREDRSQLARQRRHVIEAVSRGIDHCLCPSSSSSSCCAARSGAGGGPRSLADAAPATPPCQSRVLSTHRPISIAAEGGRLQGVLPRMVGDQGQRCPQ
jgi:hypothetical protein